MDAVRMIAGRARAIGEDKILVVPFGNKPAVVALFLGNKFPAGNGIGATVDDVAVDDDCVGLPCFKVVGDGV